MKFRGLVVIMVINFFYFCYMCCEISWKVFVFGGNGFIGSEIVSWFFKWGDEIMMVNWGNWYFDFEERIKFFVSVYFKCNRDKLFEVECEEFLVFGYYDVVIDFSFYNVR